MVHFETGDVNSVNIDTAQEKLHKAFRGKALHAQFLTLGHLATEMSWPIGADGLDKAAREWRSEFAEFKAIHAEKVRKKWMCCA